MNCLFILLCALTLVSSVSTRTPTASSFDRVHDVVIIGGGISGLAAASILSAKYSYNVGLYESHYHLGGCAHSFPIQSRVSKANYAFDSGPTIILGCCPSVESGVRPNPLQQILESVGANTLIDWINYDSWGVHTPESGNWVFELGENRFQTGPLQRFGGSQAVREFEALREACRPLCTAAAGIPTMALRGDSYRLLPLLKYYKALQQVIPYSDVLDGSFESLLNAHVKDKWLRQWIDALAFSLSGLPAVQTGAAALAYTLFDLHRPGASLDYPRGGIGKISDAFEQVIKATGSAVYTKTRIRDIAVENGRAQGVVLSDGQRIQARRGVICTANVWGLASLLHSAQQKNQLTEEQHRFFMKETKNKVKTKSFLHLHLGLDSTGLNLQKMQPHYTVMEKGLLDEDPCADRNMVAVSNPSILDDSLVDQENKLCVHAYGAGNEPYEDWQELKRFSADYKQKKEKDAEFLFRSVSKAFGIDMKEVRERSDVTLIGTPLTHERFLLRAEGTYGSAWGEMLPGPVTPLPGLLLA